MLYGIQVHNGTEQHIVHLLMFTGTGTIESGSNVNPAQGFVDFEGTTDCWITMLQQQQQLLYAQGL